MRDLLIGPRPAPTSGVTGVAILVSPPCNWCPLVHNIHIHEDVDVPLFADHIRTLTVSFDSMIPDVENPLYGNSADTYAHRRFTPSP